MDIVVPFCCFAVVVFVVVKQEVVVAVVVVFVVVTVMVLFWFVVGDGVDEFWCFVSKTANKSCKSHDVGEPQHGLSMITTVGSSFVLLSLL